MDRPAQFWLNHGHPLAQGLVFAGLGRHANSTYYHDSSHYSNHGLLTSMAVPATATSGWGWDSTLGRWMPRFDGSNDYIDCGLGIKLTGAMTISAWFNTTDVGGYGSGIGTLGTSGSRGYMLGIAGTGGWIFYIPASSSAPFSVAYGSGENFTTTHLAGVFVPSVGGYLYVNSLLANSNTTSPPASQYINALTTKIGDRGDLSGLGYLVGRIADPMIWNRALCNSEIAALADPSNTMLSGLLQYKARRNFAFIAAAAPAFKGYWVPRRRQAIGTGVM